MTGVPLRCVIDTNVAATANGAHEGASLACVVSSGRALQEVMGDGHLFVDADGLIVDEYRRVLDASGEPGPGDAFLKWVMTHEWSEQRVTRVAITPRSLGAGFEELSTPPIGVSYDPSDQKFLAVSAAHDDRPPVLQSLDSKWWGWRVALANDGVRIHFLCPSEIERVHDAKMGSG